MSRRHDKPTASDFKTFWSVFEAKQQRKQQELQARSSSEQEPKQ